MTIYVDITQLEKGRANTGIQRVVKEFVKRAAMSDSIVFKIVIFNEENKKAQILDNDEVGYFLEDIKNYQFKKKEDFDLINFKPTTSTALFDLDASWNVVFQRAIMYPRLKENGFLIFNFIHDVIPILFPDIVHDTTKKNFIPFLQSVYTYSDLVLFNSFSSEKDFLALKEKFNTRRLISTRVTGLGSDFLQTKQKKHDPFIESLLKKKYILFVGTIEPRKNQENVLEAFEILAKKYPDLNLIFIGKNGWKVEELVYKIKNHPLKDKQLFSLNSIDDDTLQSFYKNAFIVTYLSKYEGYGLPIAESLGYGNITITSKNSSMYEVGKNIADYVVYDNLNELSSLISLYYENQKLYHAKKQYIKENFKTTSWKQFYTSISDILINYEKSLELKKNHLPSLQFVFISIDKHNLEGTIKQIDKYMKFVKEYIIVTQKKLMKEFEGIESSNKITLIDEDIILGKYKEGFASRDHQSKNWLLRASLLNLEILEDEFIMLDDDNRPLKEMTIDKFIAEDGSYNAYYFYHLLEWHYVNTEYDIGQQNMKAVLSEQNYELLSYSSHCPQIINKKIFQEVVDKFFEQGLVSPIDEWSIYFNHAVSLYPCLFNKKPYETLSWPANPTDWETKVIPSEYSFENYYKELYDIAFFDETDTREQKLQKKQKQLAPYIKSKDMFNEHLDILSKNNMVHEIASFKTNDIEFYITNIPYFVVVEQDSDIKVRVNYKLFNPSQKGLDISLVIFLDGGYRTLRKLSITDNLVYQEAIIEMPIISKNLDENIYDISFNIMINNKYVYSKISPYRMKLIVIKDKETLDILGNPRLLEVIIQKKKSLKDKIKSIPFIGWLLRWGYNILRLNNLKHRVDKHQQTIEELQEIINQQQIEINKLIIDNKRNIQNYKTLNDRLDEKINTSVAKQISFQSDSFQQRLDQFIFDTKIELKQ